MKTAISLPDKLFVRADKLARRTRKSRSKVFSDAVQEYLDRHAPEEITEAMDKALEEIGDVEPAFSSAATRRVLERTEW